MFKLKFDKKLLFKESFKYLKKSLSTDNFYDRVELNEASNLAINKIIFEEVKKEKYLNIDLILILVSKVIDMHLKNRNFIYKINKTFFFEKEYFFCKLSEIFFQLLVLKSFVKAILGACFEYKINISNDVRELVIAIGFPKHSFVLNISDCYTEKIIASFGQYIEKTHSSKPLILSLDEYIRPSAKRDSCGDINNYLTYFRINPKKIFSFLNIFKVIYFIKKNSGIKKMPLYFKIIQIIMALNDYPKLKFLQSIIKSKIEIKNIYLLPRNMALSSIINDDLFKLIKVYNVSENHIKPPATYFIFNQNISNFNIDKILSTIDHNSLLTHWNYVGFCKSYYKIKKIKNIIIGNSNDHSCDFQSTPVCLGYEIDYLPNVDFTLRKIITIFDVPPEEDNLQFSKTIGGDPTACQDFVQEFLVDIEKISRMNDCLILFKPKYSLNQYSESYRILINNFSKLNHRFKIINPYTNLLRLAEVSDMNISMPYTTAKYIFESIARPAYFYIPEKYKQIIQRNSLTDNFGIIVGEKQLEYTFKSICMEDHNERSR